MVEAVDTTHAGVIAIDVPSGVGATMGEVLGHHIPADLTVALALPMTGLDAAVCRTIEPADLGIPHAVYREAGIITRPGTLGMGYRITITPN